MSRIQRPIGSVLRNLDKTAAELTIKPRGKAIYLSSFLKEQMVENKPLPESYNRATDEDADDYKIANNWRVNDEPLLEKHNPSNKSPHISQSAIIAR